MPKPILIFACGNLSRGDDALGLLLLEYIKDNINLSNIEILSDFQLQVEHALDLEERQLVLFIDASVSCKTAFNFARLQALKDNSYTTHAMKPAAVLQVFQTIKKQQPPACFLLSIQGIRFELGEEISQQAENNLQLAIHFTERLINNCEVSFWEQQMEDSFA